MGGYSVKLVGHTVTDLIPDETSDDIVQNLNLENIYKIVKETKIISLQLILL